MPSDVSLKGIEFEIKGNSAAASDSVRDLSENLSSLNTELGKSVKISKGFSSVANSLGKLGNAKLEGLQETFHDIAESLEEFSSVHQYAKNVAALGRSMVGMAKNVEGMSDAIGLLSKLSTIKFTNIAEAAEGFKQMANAMRQVAKLKEAVPNAFGNETGGYALDDPTHQWAKDMTAMVESQDKGFLANIKEVADTQGLEAVSSAIGKLSGWLGSLTHHSDGLANSVKWLKQLAKIDFTNVEKANAGLSGVGRAASAMAQISKDPAKLGEVCKWLEKLATINFSNIREAGAGLRNIAASANALAKIPQSTREVGEAAKKANGPLTQFLASIKRIAFYRIIRSIIKSITEAFSEGLTNAYEFSKLTGGALSQALDTISTKTLTMKNQLGAAFGGLLTALTPVILQAINLITKLAQAITRVIAILGGNSQWMRAKDVWTEWGEEASAAGGAAKEALRYLAPFDELNRLPSENKGGGGGANEPAYGDMFEWVSVEEGAGLADALTEAFQGVANFFESKDWAAIADSAWEGLKTAFSDTGKASQVISSLSEALGSALGAASAFTGQFAARLWDWIFGGDSNPFGDIANWVKVHIVDPFMDGFAQGIGLANKETLYANLINFCIGLYNTMVDKFFNPVIEKWNSIAEWMNTYFNTNIPTIDVMAHISEVSADDLSAAKRTIKNGILRVVKIDDDISADHKRVDVVGDFEKLSLDWTRIKVGDGISLTASPYGNLAILLLGLLSRLNADKIKGKDKVVDNLTAGLTSATDNIPIKQKTVGGSVRYEKAESKLTVAQRTFNSKALFNSRERTEDFKKKWQVFDAKAKFNDRERTQYFKDHWQIFDATANFIKRILNLKPEDTVIDVESNFTKSKDSLDDANRKVGATANFTKRYDNLTDTQRTMSATANFKYRYDNLTDDRRTFSSTANFKSAKDALTTAVKTFNSIANFTSREDNISTTFASKADINSYSIANDLKDWEGNLNVDAKVNIVGQANTPTVSVNANYNVPMVKAKGGAFYGGSWHNIPQYASGGSPHGSLFVAGEAGPEVVGHIGGRTEVLNRSQLASTMYAAVRSAMSGASGDSGMGEETMYRAFSRALADSDLGGNIELDGDTLYRAMVNRNRANTRMTGVNAMA